MVFANLQDSHVMASVPEAVARTILFCLCNTQVLLIQSAVGLGAVVQSAGARIHDSQLLTCTAKLCSGEQKYL